MVDPRTDLVAGMRSVVTSSFLSILTWFALLFSEPSKHQKGKYEIQYIVL